MRVAPRTLMVSSEMADFYYSQIISVCDISRAFSNALTLEVLTRRQKAYTLFTDVGQGDPCTSDLSRWRNNPLVDLTL
jgi:hypothetical protein